LVACKKILRNAKASIEKSKLIDKDKITETFIKPFYYKRIKIKNIDANANHDIRQLNLLKDCFF
jgi:hypothetical protein